MNNMSKTNPMSSTLKSGGRRKGAAARPNFSISISDEHKQQLRIAFDKFDSAGTGRIKASDIKVASYALGYDMNTQELSALLQECGIGGINEQIDFSEFFTVLMRMMTRKDSRLECVRAFKQIDEDEKGHISIDDLRNIAESLQMDLTDDELQEMLLFAHPARDNAGGSDFDAKETLTVNETEFLDLMKRAHAF